MFLHSCFIHKCTANVISKLNQLGYSVAQGGIFSFGAPLAAGQGAYRWFPEDIITDIPGIIDCGDNEKLFLAIAAINDETDKYQYFVNEVGAKFVNQGIEIPAGSLTLLLNDKCPLEGLRKASVEEIVNWFNEGNEGYDW